jgi:hypothetical protein
VTAPAGWIATDRAGLAVLGVGSTRDEAVECAARRWPTAGGAGVVDVLLPATAWAVEWAGRVLGAEGSPGLDLGGAVEVRRVDRPGVPCPWDAVLAAPGRCLIGLVATKGGGPGEGRVGRAVRDREEAWARVVATYDLPPGHDRLAANCAAHREYAEAEGRVRRARVDLARRCARPTSPGKRVTR